MVVAAALVVAGAEARGVLEVVELSFPEFTAMRNKISTASAAHGHFGFFFPLTGAGGAVKPAASGPRGRVWLVQCCPSQYRSKVGLAGSGCQRPEGS